MSNVCDSVDEDIVSAHNNAAEVTVTCTHDPAAGAHDDVRDDVHDDVHDGIDSGCALQPSRLPGRIGAGGGGPDSGGSDGGDGIRRPCAPVPARGGRAGGCGRREEKSGGGNGVPTSVGKEGNTGVGREEKGGGANGGKSGGVHALGKALTLGVRSHLLTSHSPSMVLVSPHTVHCEPLLR